MCEPESVDLDELRKPAIVEYDTTRYPFRRIVLRALEIPVPDDSAEGPILEVLRAEEDRREFRSGSGFRGSSTPWIQRWYRDKTSAAVKEAHADFHAVYHDFLRQVVLPTVKDPQGILFQRDPTFRCHVAGGGAPTGRLHCDADYGHQLCELNFWLPLTRVHGSNSLYAESTPGRGDYSAFELGYGGVQRFWGAACRHYTVANTSDITRVSFDFRVVPRSCHRPDESKFAIGGFYLLMDACGAVPSVEPTGKHPRPARDGTSRRKAAACRAARTAAHSAASSLAPSPPDHSVHSSSNTSAGTCAPTSAVVFPVNPTLAVATTVPIATAASTTSALISESGSLSPTSPVGEPAATDLPPAFSWWEWGTHLAAPAAALTKIIGHLRAGRAQDGGGSSTVQQGTIGPASSGDADPSAAALGRTAAQTTDEATDVTADLDSSLDGICGICLDSLQGDLNARSDGSLMRGSIACKHTFHALCLRQWLEQYSGTCPTCRGGEHSVASATSTSTSMAQSIAHLSTGAAWLWSWTSLMLIPWPRPAAATAPTGDSVSEEWDASRGIGDWRARMAAIYAAEAADEAAVDSSDSDDSTDEVVDPANAYAPDKGSDAVGKAERHESELSDAELLARHPWLNE